MRPPHTLKPTKSGTRPRRVIFFDTETNQERMSTTDTLHTLRLGVAKVCGYDPERGLQVIKKLIFTTSDELWLWVDKNSWSGRTTYLVGHNLVFDLSVVGGFIQLGELGWKLNSFYSKGMVSIFRWKKGRRKLVGLDNCNFFAGPLEVWGKRLNLLKMKVDFETVSDHDLLVYCERDVDIMIACWRTWLQFIDTNQCGAFKPTVASTAFGAWRHRFMSSKVHVHSHKLALQLERDAFRGGRTECLWVGHRDDGPFYYLDVNNMYGHVMKTYKYPSGHWGYLETDELFRLAYKLKRYAVIARVVVDVDEPWFPYKNGPHTCYPIGMFETTLTTPELKLCVERNWLVSVSAMSWYRQERIFSDYVTTFNRIRTDYKIAGHVGYEKICKLLINALYGKFGQRGFKQEVIGSCPAYVIKREEVYNEQTGQFFDQVYLGGRILREWKEGESYHSFPAITAHVTAYARMYLYSLVKSLSRRDVFYMDTDSLITNAQGIKVLSDHIRPNVIGELKVEHQSPWLIINSPKDYAMEGRTKLKGISRSAVEIKSGTYQQTHWLKLSGIIRNEISQGYITKQVIKTPRRVIHSGMVRSNGWVLPFDFVRPQPVSFQSDPPLRGYL